MFLIKKNKCLLLDELFPYSDDFQDSLNFDFDPAYDQTENNSARGGLGAGRKLRKK